MKNVQASVLAKLRNLNVPGAADYNLVLTRYCAERFIFRLSSSAHADQFVLKGATLFWFWRQQYFRSTRDVDFLGFGESTPGTLARVFVALCDIACEEDGVRFDPQSVEANEIREDLIYGGTRIKLTAYIGTVCVPLRFDVGFGDAITPAAQTAVMPVLLPMPAAELKIYPQETVVAEKLEALVKLGMGNSRLKDYYDLWVLATQFTFTGPLLAQAVRATFDRRETELPKQLPLGLTDEFALDAAKKTQWQAFKRKSSAVDAPDELSVVLEIVRPFLWPLIQAARDQQEFDGAWSGPGEGWGP